MKLEATIVISLQAPDLGRAGATLDDVLRRAVERSDVDLQSVRLQTPAGHGPVSLPQPPPAVTPLPHPHPARDSAI